MIPYDKNSEKESNRHIKNEKLSILLRKNKIEPERIIKCFNLDFILKVFKIEGFIKFTELCLR